MKLETDRIVLTPLTEADIEWTRRTRNEFHEYFYTEDYITKEQQRAWYERYKENSGHDYFFIIRKKGTNERMGTISLYNISHSDRTAELGRIIVLQEFQGQGYMEEAINLVFRVAFDDLRLYKIRLSTHLDNIQAISLYAKCGFKALTRPVILLEKFNPGYDSKKPIVLMTYDTIDGGDGDYESQSSNIL